MPLGPGVAESVGHQNHGYTQLKLRVYDVKFTHKVIKSSMLKLWAARQSYGIAGELLSISVPDALRHT